MFGYVRPQKCELKIREFDAYKAVYCALCFSLQKNFGAFAKSYLNYDFVFAAMLGLSVNGYKPEYDKKHCNTNCLKKCPVARHDAIIDYCAGALCLSSYYKLVDNVRDERFFRRLGARILLVFARHSRKKAEAFYPELANVVGTYFDAHVEIENDPDTPIDLAADNTARALSLIFAGMSDDETTKRVLERVGYLTGRFVYLADCGDDLTDDIRKKRFNPLISRFSIKSADDTDTISTAREFIKAEIHATASELADCYNLMSPAAYKSILDNIIYLGLHYTASQIGEKRKGTDNVKSV